MACGMSVMELLKHCLRVSNDIPAEERTTRVILLRRYIQQAYDLQTRNNFTEEEIDGEENI